MFESVLKKHDPRDNRSHGILIFLSEELSDSEKIEFIDLIFEWGSWVLPTHISKSSNSSIVKEKTQEKFQRIFNYWVEERITFSSKLINPSKNLPLGKAYRLNFEEALMSIRNLEFPLEMMHQFERFVNSCQTDLFSKYLEGSIISIIEEFSAKEIETFFSYISNLYIKNNSPNLGKLIFKILNSLAFSPVIFSLSAPFLINLNLLVTHIKNHSNKHRYSHLISVLLIELIENKKLNLTYSIQSKFIHSTLISLDKTDHNNFQLFKFLRRFKYQFEKFEFVFALDNCLEEIYKNINKVKNNDFRTKTILADYIEFGDKKFELFLFYLNFVSDELVFKYFVKFIKAIDELRKSFSYILWFDEFLNFKTLEGEIDSSVNYGFYVKIKDDNILKRLEDSNPDSFTISKYSYGFINHISLKDYPEIRKLYKYDKKNNVIEGMSELDINISNNLKSFTIVDANYYRHNKGKILTLIPKNETLIRFVKAYRLKALFTSVELFFVKYGFQFLNSSFLRDKDSYWVNKLFNKYFNHDYIFNINEEIFWKTVKKIRHNLYKNIYLKKKKENVAFDIISNAYAKELVLDGRIISRIKGGMLVNILGKEVFLPASQLDIKLVEDFEKYIGRTMKFRIVQINGATKNVVISHKLILDNKLRKEKIKTLENLKIGQKFNGFVKNITNIGAFVSFEGAEGLIYITDLAYGRILHPKDILSIGDNIDVVVLNFDDDKTRIALGLKQLQKDPWERLNRNLKEGQIIKGKVVNIEDYGAFIEIIPGVEGLIHNSEVTWDSQSVNTRSYFKLGEEHKVKIVTLDRNKRIISLSIKQIDSVDPWSFVEEYFPIGSKHLGVVENINSKGLYVFLEMGNVRIGGMVFNNNIAWIRNFKNPNELFAIGDKIEVVILKINIENRILKLCHKSTQENPLLLIEKYFPVGSFHKVIVIEITKKWIVVDLTNGIKAFGHFKHMKKNNKRHVKIGETLIVQIQKNKHKILVSHRNYLMHVQNLVDKNSV